MFINKINKLENFILELNKKIDCLKLSCLELKSSHEKNINDKVEENNNLLQKYKSKL
jgi:hypothetical protein